jgi:hypothetical protein
MTDDTPARGRQREFGEPQQTKGDREVAPARTAPHAALSGRNTATGRAVHQQLRPMVVTTSHAFIPTMRMVPSVASRTSAPCPQPPRLDCAKRSGRH